MPGSIPLRVIQVWRSRTPARIPAPAAAPGTTPPVTGDPQVAGLPLRCRASFAATRALNPAFEHLFFNGDAMDEFVAREFPEHLPVYAALPSLIQKCDFFRYLAVFRLGGFYLDLDIFLTTSLSALQSHACVFPFEGLNLCRFLRRRYGMDWGIGNYAFGAEAGHPFIAAIIDNCVRAQKDPQWVNLMMQGVPRPLRTEFRVLYMTGPGLITRTLAENPHLAKQVTVLFPQDVRDRATWWQFGEMGAHILDGGWRTRSRVADRLLRKACFFWMRRTLFKESDRMGATR